MKCKNCGKRITNPLYASLGYGEECLGKVHLSNNNKLVVPDMSFLKNESQLYKVIDRGEFYKNLNINFNKALKSKNDAIKNTYNFITELKNHNKKEKNESVNDLIGMSSDFQLKGDLKDKSKNKFDTIDLITVGLLHCNPQEVLSEALDGKDVDTLPFSHLKFITDNLPLTNEAANYIHEELGINEDEENE